MKNFKFGRRTIKTLIYGQIIFLFNITLKINTINKQKNVKFLKHKFN